MYLNRRMSKAEERYWPTDLEVAALVWACRKLRVWLQSTKLVTTVLTDPKATPSIVNQSTLRTRDVAKINSRLIHASIYLSQYRLDVRHIPGKLNLAPDALSRLPNTDDYGIQPERDSELDDMEALAYACYSSVAVEMDGEFKKQIQEGYGTDVKYSKIHRFIKQREDLVRRMREKGLPAFTPMVK